MEKPPESNKNSLKNQVRPLFLCYSIQFKKLYQIHVLKRIDAGYYLDK